MIINLIMFLCCYLSGAFLGVMFLTIIENVSKGFRQFIRKMCYKITFLYRRILEWTMIVIMFAVGFLFLPWSLTINGLLSGFVGGLFVYFKAGVTMGNSPDPYNKNNPYAKNKGGKGGKGGKYAKAGAQKKEKPVASAKQEAQPKKTPGSDKLRKPVGMNGGGGKSGGPQGKKDMKRLKK